MKTKEPRVSFTNLEAVRTMRDYKGFFSHYFKKTGCWELFKLKKIKGLDC